MKQVTVKIEYYPQLKDKKIAYKVLMKQKINISNIFNVESYLWKDIGSFPTLFEAEEFALSRAEHVEYKKSLSQ